MLYGRTAKRGPVAMKQETFLSLFVSIC